MFYSKIFIPTLREVSQETEAVSHKLLLRAGFIRQLASGLYIFLPLGWKTLMRIIAIIRDEMNSIGAQEFLFPALHPAEIWQQTGRWYEIREEMFRLKDRGDREMCLGMTHEEVMTWLASKEIRSYRELPQIWYQFQVKFRDEARPKAGLMRTREFIMKDSYSFDADEDGLSRSYELHRKAYHRIFERCGLRFYEVQSDPGMMGGGESHEFMAPSHAGEDDIMLCDKCGYSANVEVAGSIPEDGGFSDTLAYEEIYTPDISRVKDVADFLKTDEKNFIKTLALMTNSGIVIALIRGDQNLHEKKLQKIIGSFRTCLKEEIIEGLGVEPGFLGPQGIKGVRIVADSVLRKGSYITGANKKDYHVKGIRPGIHFDAEWNDIHLAKEGDGCPHCGFLLRKERAIEIGNIFKLGTKYSIPLRAFYLDKSGVEKPMVMGSYGIGPARIMVSAVEQNHDVNGIIWPPSISPFHIEIIPLNMDHNVMSIAENVYNILTEKGYDILLDDRDLRPGVKFKDADLIGIPYQVIIGERSLKEGYIEVKKRRTGETEKVRPDRIDRYGF